MNNEWTVFATIFGKMQPPIVGWIDQTIDAIAGQIRLPLLAAFVVFIAGYMLIRTFAPDAHPLSTLERKLLRCAIAFTLATSVVAYRQFVRDLALATLPTWLSSTLTAGLGVVVQIGASAFDSIWNKAYLAGAAFDGHLSRWGDIGLHLLVAIYWLVSGAVIAVAFAEWLFAYVAIALLVGTGPLFVSFLAFPATNGMFDRWLGSLLGALLLQGFIIALLVLMTGAEAEIIGQVAAAGQDGSTLAGQVVHEGQHILGGLLLFLVCAYMLFQLRGLVSGVVNGGVSVSSSGMMAAAGGAMASLAMRGGAAARGAATAATGTASSGSAPIVAPPRSLSSAA